MKIEGVPEGYELVRIGIPTAGETAIDTEGRPMAFDRNTFVGGYAIVRKIPEPLQLREGAWYERRDGKVVGPIAKVSSVPGCEFQEPIYNRTYFPNGSWIGGESPEDLIREVPPPKPAIDPGEGWRLLEKDELVQQGDEVYDPKIDKWYVSINVGAEQVSACPYRRRIAPKYRPFANAEEFMPHRDKWIRRKDKDAGRTWKPCYYANDCVTLASHAQPTLYSKLLDMFEFTDGTPCGVKE